MVVKDILIKHNLMNDSPVIEYRKMVNLPDEGEVDIYCGLGQWDGIFQSMLSLDQKPHSVEDKISKYEIVDPCKLRVWYGI